tara:strand:- start:242 stop:856 length:615 start_codon:yes stop_codon:yes gene_type:complete
MSKNPLIVFEGIEGSGKTTHINHAANYLKKNNKQFIKIREPGGSKNSEKIRKLLLSSKSNFNNKTDLFLYLASRSENVEKIILKYHKKKIILIDRFIDSTIAYQHYGMGINKNLINKLNSFLLKSIKPDYTFLYKVSKKNLIKRLKKRKIKNRYDKFSFAFYKKVQNGFLKTIKNNKKSMVIDSNISQIENKKIIINKLVKILK